MVIGVIALSDLPARRLLECLTGALRDSWSSCSLCEGIAIACGTAGDTICSGSFRAEGGYVGTLLGDIPEPGAELRGDFAFIGEAGGHLRLARGRFAGRPLYWLRVGSTTVASSRLLPLAIAARRELKLDLDHLFALFDPRLRLLGNPPPFVGVQTVRANTIVDIDRSGTVRTYEGPLHLDSELTLSAKEIASALRDEFQAAVTRRCAGVRRVAVLGGGGVDSSNLLATAVHNAHRAGAPSVIPVAFDYGGVGDDRPHLRALRRHLDVEPLRVVAGDGSAFGLQDRVIDAAAHASVPSAMVLAAMARAKSAGADLVIGGDASELLLDSDGAVFGDFLLTKPLRALACASRFAGVYETRRQSWRRLVVGPTMRQFGPPFVVGLRDRWNDGRAGRRRANELEWAGSRLRTFLISRREYPPRPPIYSQRDRVRRLASSEILMASREYASRWEIASGLPMAMPYLDDDFVRFVARIPSEAIFAGARERGLLRESMEGLVPDSVRYRMDKARPHEAFADGFLAMRDNPELHDLVTMRELSTMGIVDAKRFAAAFTRFAADPYANPAAWSGLWPAITAEAYVRWFRAFQAGNAECSMLPRPVAAPA